MMASIPASIACPPPEDAHSQDRFRALLEEVSAACSRVAKRMKGRDRAGLLMAAALLRLDMVELASAPCGKAEC